MSCTGASPNGTDTGPGASPIGLPSKKTAAPRGAPCKVTATGARGSGAALAGAAVLGIGSATGSETGAAVLALGLAESVVAWVTRYVAPAPTATRRAMTDQLIPKRRGSVSPLRTAVR